MQLRGGCVPLLWVAVSAAILRWFSRYCKMTFRLFVTCGIADELSSDGRLEFTAEETQQQWSNWCVHRRLSSVALAHSSGRARLGVKTCKRMLMDNTGPNSEVKLDKFQSGYFKTLNTATPLTAIPVYPLYG